MAQMKASENSNVTSPEIRCTTSQLAHSTHTERPAADCVGMAAMVAIGCAKATKGVHLCMCMHALVMIRSAHRCGPQVHVQQANEGPVCDVVDGRTCSFRCSCRSLQNRAASYPFPVASV